jgi:hypothetical protein
MYGGLMARADNLFGNDLPPRPRAVVDALSDARKASTGFVLSCGLLPEISESCTESLHREVHRLSEAHFDREGLVTHLHELLRERGMRGDAVAEVDDILAPLLAADTTAAYLFGLAAGLALGSLDRRLSEHLR